MINNLDVYSMAEKVAHDSRTGKLFGELLAKGYTLYGKSMYHPNLIERINPNGEKALGHWMDGTFFEKRS